jgi:uncharacterized protein
LGARHDGEKNKQTGVRNVVHKVKVKIIEAVHKLLSLRASPHQIATGFAAGVFIGIFPTFGLGGLLILALAPWWKFNVPASLTGTFFGNPLLAPLWIFLSCLITDISPSEIKLPDENLRQILGHYSQIGVKYLLGNSLVSLFVAIASYFVLIRTLRWFYRRKKKSDLTRLKL